MVIDCIKAVLCNNYVLFAGMFLSLFYKFFVLGITTKYTCRQDTNRVLLVLLFIFLFGALLQDVGFVGSFIKRKLIAIDGDIPYFTLICRLGWIVFITHYQASALFLTTLVEGKCTFRRSYIVHLLINILITGPFTYLAFFKYGTNSASSETFYFELRLIECTYLYLLCLFVPLLYKTIKKMRLTNTPRILKHQVHFLLIFFVSYFLLQLLCNRYTISSSFLPFLKDYKYFVYMLSMLLGSAAVYMCARKVMGLRFLNVRKTVESKEKFDFLCKFKDILEQLNYATALQELGHVTQTFFYTAFGLPLSLTQLYIRKPDASYSDEELTSRRSAVELFLSKREHSQLKIYMRDELEFSNFYEPNTALKEIIEFLDAINADAFLPIYERNTVTAYIIIERNARPKKLFTSKNRDEMLVFTSYLSNIITVIKYAPVELIHQRYNALTQELYHKHQEINQYKESIRSFMRSSYERKIGIVYYKNRHFTLANEEAHTFLGFDLNTAIGHPLSQTCKALAQRVHEYKTAQSTMTRDSKNNKIIIAGVPSIDDNTVILLIYYPEIADIMRTKFEQLADPSMWDYVLYLETTRSGQLINQLIPGDGEKILNYKIQLLSTALSKKATLLQLPEKDIPGTVSLLHHMSLRSVLHEMRLTAQELHDEVAIALFGLNPLLQKDASAGLLQKLDTIGTLFIENVEYLNLETQKYLAEFITCGYFRQFKSDHKIVSNVRIFFSTSKNLARLVQEGLFSQALFNELSQTSLATPSLQTLSETEIGALAESYAEHMETDSTYKNLLALTEKDKATLNEEKPVSFFELKERVHDLLVEKSAKHNLHEVTEFDPAFNISEPDIAHAVRLGKKALKDRQLMTLLWNKFKNQNKIAILLAVNRSTVNRRCQEYDLK